MRSLIIVLLISVALNAAFARNLVKRNCNYNDCSSSCSTPCNRPNNCNNNNNNNRYSCNNIVEDDSDSVPVLIPFPPISNTTYPKPSAESTTNNTNINNSTVEVSIKNTIDNVNNISVPISLNSTNENTVIIHFERVPTGNPARENHPTVAPSTVDCCLVVTPRECDRNGENCQEKREWICSEICRGSTIIDDPEPPAQLTVRNVSVPLCKLANGTSVACSNQAADPEPHRLTVIYATIPPPLIVEPLPLCELPNGTSIACPTHAPVYSVPQQVIYQPAPQPIYYNPWLSTQKNITTRPIQQVSQIPIQPIYMQQRPINTLPATPVVATQPLYPHPTVQYIPQAVQQPVRAVQSLHRYMVIPQAVPQYIPQAVPQYIPQALPQYIPQAVPRMDQRQYLGQYQGTMGAAFWGAYQRPYQTPCSSQSSWQPPCGSSAVQY